MMRRPSKHPSDQRSPPGATPQPGRRRPLQPGLPQISLRSQDATQSGLLRLTDARPGFTTQTGEALRQGPGPGLRLRGSEAERLRGSEAQRLRG